MEVSTHNTITMPGILICHMPLTAIIMIGTRPSTMETSMHPFLRTCFRPRLQETHMTCMRAAGHRGAHLLAANTNKTHNSMNKIRSEGRPHLST